MVQKTSTAKPHHVTLHSSLISSQSLHAISHHDNHNQQFQHPSTTTQYQTQSKHYSKFLVIIIIIIIINNININYDYLSLHQVIHISLNPRDPPKRHLRDLARCRHLGRDVGRPWHRRRSGATVKHHSGSGKDGKMWGKCWENVGKMEHGIRR